MKFFVVIVFLSALNYSSQKDTAEITEAQHFINKFSDDDRGNFIKYYLRKALRNEGKFMSRMEMDDYDFQEVDPPDFFEENLLTWVTEEFEIPMALVGSLLISGEVCIPDTGECYNVNDIGALCCPF